MLNYVSPYIGTQHRVTLLISLVVSSRPGQVPKATPTYPIIPIVVVLLLLLLPIGISPEVQADFGGCIVLIKCAVCILCQFLVVPRTGLQGKSQHKQHPKQTLVGLLYQIQGIISLHPCVRPHAEISASGAWQIN